MSRRSSPQINCCKVPDTVADKEANIYRLILNRHCGHPDKDGQHQCCGRISINRKSITLQCSKCGDAKRLLA